MKKLLFVLVCIGLLTGTETAHAVFSVTQGGTGQSSFLQGWLYSPGGTTPLVSSTSPTVDSITATSPSLVSSFAGGLQALALDILGNASTTNLAVTGDSFLAINDGQIGIATTTVSPKRRVSIVGNGSIMPVGLHIQNSGNNDPVAHTTLELEHYNSHDQAVNTVLFRTGGGTAESPTPPPFLKVLGSLEFQGYNGTGIAGFSSSRAAMRVFATQAWTDTAQGTAIQFRTTPNDSTTISSPRMTIDHNGNVGIGMGTLSATQKLEVNGGVKLKPTESKPTCDSSSRGTFWFTRNDTGVQDSVEVCAKDAADTYDWRTLY